MPKKQLSAAQGIEAGCILFELNSTTGHILAMVRQAGLPAEYLDAAGADRVCEEWRAFVHAVVTAGLMQHAPNCVLMGYLRQTGNLLAASLGGPQSAAYTGAHSSLASFVDGPFARYMPLLAQAEQARCPDLFCQRLADHAQRLSPPDAQVRARLAAVMAMVISAVWDKLEQYEILPQ